MNKWRFIDTEIHSVAMNMALDEACMEELSLKKHYQQSGFIDGNLPVFQLVIFKT